MRNRTTAVCVLGLSLAASIVYLTSHAAHKHAWAQATKKAEPGLSPEEQKAALMRLTEEVLARCDRSRELRHQLELQKLTTAQAEAASKTAELNLTAAKLALDEYREGTFVAERQKAQGEIALAKSELERAEDRMAWTDRMVERGHVSLAEKAATSLELAQARFSVETAQTALAVLEKFTKPKESNALGSKIERAQIEYEAKQAAWRLESKNEQALGERIGEESLVPAEVEALGLLDAALQLHEKRQFPEAQTKLEQASRSWHEAESKRAERRLTELGRRIHEAAGTAR